MVAQSQTTTVVLNSRDHTSSKSTKSARSSRRAAKSGSRGSSRSVSSRRADVPLGGQQIDDMVAQSQTTTVVLSQRDYARSTSRCCSPEKGETANQIEQQTQPHTDPPKGGRKKADIRAANANSIEEAARLARADVTDTLFRDTFTSERVLISYDQLVNSMVKKLRLKCWSKQGECLMTTTWGKPQRWSQINEISTAEHLSEAEAVLNKLEVNIDPDRDPSASSSGTGSSQK